MKFFILMFSCVIFGVSLSNFVLAFFIMKFESIGSIMLLKVIALSANGVLGCFLSVAMRYFISKGMNDGHQKRN